MTAASCGVARAYSVARSAASGRFHVRGLSDRTTCADVGMTPAWAKRARGGRAHALGSPEASLTASATEDADRMVASVRGESGDHRLRLVGPFLRRGAPEAPVPIRQMYPDTLILGHGVGHVTSAQRFRIAGASERRRRHVLAPLQTVSSASPRGHGQASDVCRHVIPPWPYTSYEPASFGLIPCLTPVTALESRTKNSPYHVGVPRFWLVAIM